MRRAWGGRQPRSRAFNDAVVFIVATVAIYIVLYLIDFHDTLEAWFHSNEFYELDELLHALTLTGIAGFIYAARRMHELRGEIAQRKRAERHAHRLARHDPLTGLPNRRRFLEEFPTLVAGLPAEGGCAVFLLDLDHFKPVNDLYGHRFGDKVLQAISDRLEAIIGDSGMVARLGGDEFGVLYRYEGNGDAVIKMAQRVVQEIPEPLPITSLAVNVGVSLGIAIYRGGVSAQDGAMQQNVSVDTLLHRADMAMYRAKHEERGAYRFFDQDMDDRLQERFQLELEIKSAVSSGQIVPYYQPLVDLRSRNTVGYEVLARWDHPDRGLISPDSFIAIAEETGLIGVMTFSLLRKAIEDAANWPEEVYLSINLSPRQFADGLLYRKIAGILAETAFPPRRLQIEITETAMVQRLEEAKITVSQLHDLGVRVALDDFGTGYAGLYHLRELKLSALKIDRGYVAEILKNPQEFRIVEAMIRLGRALGLQTTAEGIENEAVVESLLALGCENGQGYFFGTPAPAAGAEIEVLRRRDTGFAKPRRFA